MLVDNVNPAREKLRDGGKVSACWLQAGSNVTAEIVAESGVDVGVIDMEHGPGDIIVLTTQIQAMKNCPAVPFVRAPWNDMVVIKRILDAGAYGLIVPYVNTGEEAIRAVAAAQYPPAGIRGIAGSPRAPHYANQSIEYFKRANDAIFIFTQVETVEAIKNLDAILAVERVDGIFIGPMDLSTSMGYFANPGASAVKEAILGVEKKVLAAGKVLATVGSGWEDAKEKYDRGYGMVINMSDTMTLGQAVRERVAPFRKAFGGL
ncbi:MAG: 2,4-dihydroxyhept-2-ene-1,7-dioic acid aldolase [Planctomycetota bacterium]|jgi:2-dehydro-3-deoxyglucarate aldolase/4-hydroxy-2-oxoheptanedioate aldolase|nr:2,4-dihydroxyhept-2-ene-1,7-dioic acid aldolase [Planctomycetota bacterium]